MQVKNFGYQYYQSEGYLKLFEMRQGGGLPKQRRFECVLDEEEEKGTASPAAKQMGGRRKGKKKKQKAKKKKKLKPVALRAENLVVRLCKACGKARGATKLQACGGCGLAHYCGAGCRKAAWRGHKAFCNFSRKETEKAKAASVMKAASAAKAKAAKSSAAASAAPGSGAGGIGSGRGGGQSGNRADGGANDVGLGPATNGSLEVRLRMASS